jgi:hypothetical protein
MNWRRCISHSLPINQIALSIIGGVMELLGLFFKEVVACRTELSSLLAQSDVELYEITGLDPTIFHKEIKTNLKQTCTRQWKYNYTVKYPIHTFDFTLIKLSVLYDYSHYIKCSELEELFSDAIFKLSKDNISKFNKNVYSFASEIAGEVLCKG